ncbi:MAG: isoaspartyl peptidase/L-asparaginase [Calditrichia bacterium]|nr:isoaspartyl peptidase/L-asparaginase [Calditrichia bacterium]
MEPKLIVHGGAWNIPDKYHQAHIDGCYAAVEAVASDLENGLNALDAVEKAVNVLEENTTFNAGKGSYLNSVGEIELDAIICDGKTLNFGAVAAVQNILHPVSVAKLLLKHPEHCFLVGEGVQQFLRENQIPEVAVEDLLTERELIYYQKIKADPHFRTRKPFEPSPMDTVGAVAMDSQGDFAAATSTGGTPRKLPGRAGDSPVIGAGAYADNQAGAVSATGYGEAIMKVLLSKVVCDSLINMPAMAAAKHGIAILEKRVNGLGGVIGVNCKGEYAYSHNTPYMAFAYCHKKAGIISQIKINDPAV